MVNGSHNQNGCSDKNSINRRKFLLGTGSAASALSLAGCAGTNQSNSGGGQNNSGGGSTAGNAKSKRATIHLVTDATAKDTLEKSFDNWADTVDANVSRQFEFLGFDSMVKKLTTYFGTGNPPDLVYGAYGGFAQYLAAGYMEDLTDFVNERLPSISKGWLDEVRYDDKLLGIPAFADYESAWIRQDIYEKYNIKPAKTYQQQRKNVKILDENIPDDMDPIHIIANPNDGATEYANDNWFLSNEAYWNKRNSQSNPPEIMINKSPQKNKAIESLKLLNDLYKYSPDSLNDSYDELINSFITEKVAKTQFSGRILVNLHEKAPQLAKVIKRVDHPAGNKGRKNKAFQSPQVWAVTKKSNNKKLSADFVEYFMTSDAYIDLALANPLHDVPARAKVMDTSRYKNNDIVKAHPDVLEYNKTTSEQHVSLVSRSNILGSTKTPYWKEAVRGSQMITPTMYSEVITGRKDPEQAVDDASKKLKSNCERLQQRFEQALNE